ncbi:MAG: flagellar type III secretion system pore protein FliP [Calditrichia bacterium]
MTVGRRKNKFMMLLVLVFCLVILPAELIAQGSNPTPLPKVTIGIDQTDNPEELVPALQILFLLTVLSLAPSILVLMTSFTRIVIVFYFLRQSLSTQSVPSNQILIGLALFLTFFIMRPVIDEVNEKALQPYLNNQHSQQVAFEKALKPMRAFLLKHAEEKDIQLFIDMQGIAVVQGPDDIPLTSLIPAFIISELTRAFKIGFLLYLPMLLIDLVVGSILLSMGMMMLPPVMISMPFKILLFVLVDGWYLLIESLVKGFG